MSRNKRSRRDGRGDGQFVCQHCRRPVDPGAFGTHHLNHCPHCLWSRHVDDSPGDRAAACGGNMEPIAVWVKRDGEWAIVHRCNSCGKMGTNRIAGDDSEWALLALAATALANPPFPIA